MSKARLPHVRLILFIVGILACACVPEQEKFTFDTSAQLRFSADSVTFDTVFTDLGSTTQRLKVYNDSKNAVRISNITLGSADSPFSITVNGKAASSFEEVRLLGEDSMQVLVEVFIDPRDEDLPFLVTEQLEFLTNGNEQQVTLVAYGQDAVFLNGVNLDCNTVFTADRPYLIYNSVLVPEGCSLTVEPGARIFNHNASYVFVGGSLDVQGTASDSVVFTNDRFDEFFLNAPGQWGGIVFLENSGPHNIDHARIRNAQIGLYVGIPDDDEEIDVVVSNTIIENIGGSDILPDGDFEILPGFGILAFNSDIYAYNVVINNCQARTIGTFAGGTYQFDHCTFANFSFDFFRTDPSILLADNAELGDGTILRFPLTAVFQNSILWGSLPDEIQISISEPGESTLAFGNNIVKTQEFATELPEGNLINADPLFMDAEGYNYQLSAESPAIDAGLDLGIPTDILSRPRDVSPDMGAYENQK